MRFKSRRITSWLLCMMLTLAMAFTAVGCGTTDNGDSNQPSTGAMGSEGTEPTVLGEGTTKFTFIVVDKEGKETYFEIYTDKTIVGEALLEVDLIAGDAGPYGLYVTTVNGITAAYDVDQTYWAFYVNGEYATSGVDSTTIKEGETYSFKVEK